MNVGPRVVAAAFALGLSLAGPQAVAIADTDDGGAAGGSTQAGSARAGAARDDRSARPSRAVESVHSVPTRAGARAAASVKASAAGEVPVAGDDAAAVRVEVVAVESFDQPAVVVAELAAEAAGEAPPVDLPPVDLSPVDVAPVDVAPVGVALTDQPVEVDPIGDSVAVSDADDTDVADGGRGGLNPLPWWRSGAAGGALSDTDPVIAPIAVVVDSPAPSEITAPELVTSETTVATVSPTLFSTPVLATPAQVVRTVGIRVAQVLDRTADWLGGLPANPVTDFLSGALLLVRRTLLPGVPNIPSARVANTWAVEGSPGATTEAVFTVTLGRAYDTPITLSYATTAPSPLGFVRNLLEGDLVEGATPGQDFTAQTGTLTFAPGQTSQQVSIPVLGDTIEEPNEIFGLTVFAEVPSGSPVQAASGKSGETARSAAATGVTLINLASADGEIKQGGREFQIQNLTRYAVKYDGPTGYGLRPGSILDVGMTALVWMDPIGSVRLSYVSVDSPQPTTYYVNLAIFNEVGRPPDPRDLYINWSTSTNFCRAGRDAGCNWSQSDTVALWDNPATTVTVGAEDRSRQVYLLGLCDGNGASSCTYAVKRDGSNQPMTPTSGYGLAHLPTGFSPIVNGSNQNSDTSITVTDAATQGTTWSISSSLKPKFAFLDKIVEATISGSYGGSSSATHTFSQTTKVVAQPGETAYIFTATPVLRYTGTWTVKLGKPENNEGTTYTLTDTYIDRPNPSGIAPLIVYTCKTGSDNCITAQNGKVPADLPGVPPPLPGTTQGAGRETRDV